MLLEVEEIGAVVRDEKQIASYKMWTRVTDPLSLEYNRYAKRSSGIITL